MDDSTMADPSSGPSGSQIFGGVLQLATVGEQAFATYEGAQTAKKAVSKLNSNSLMYVILGLGALGIIALVVIKH